MTNLVRTSSIVLISLAVAVVGCADASKAPSPAAVTTTALAPSSTATPSSSTAATAPEGAPVDLPTPTRPPATTSSAPAGLPPIPEAVAVPPTLEGLPLAYIAVEGEALLVAIAGTGAARRQGLMAVTDLADLDGMLFTWTSDTSGGFWMRDTVLPLDIAFFDVAGDLVVTFPMEPCDLGAQCPVYDPGATYRYALETRRGRLGGLSDDAHLTLPEGLSGSD